jgi:pimeloyl-ACP methyl ester carboxylesterase
VTWTTLTTGPVRSGTRRAGDRRPVTVAAVHGLADTASTWRPLAERLGTGFRVHAVDAPWGGATGVTWSAMTGDRPGAPARPGGWLRRALAELPGPVDVLVGHSFGANAVLDHLAGGADPQPAAAVLIAPLVRPPGTASRPVLLARTRAAIRQVVAEGLRARLGHRAAAVPAEVFASMVDGVLAAVPQGAAEVVLDRLLVTPRPELRRVGVPTLVLAGLDDQKLAGVRADTLTVMPAAEVRIRPQFDHFCHITLATVVAAECAEFLDRAVPASAPAGPPKEVYA